MYPPWIRSDSAAKRNRPILLSTQKTILLISQTGSYALQQGKHNLILKTAVSGS